ncbi:hypothetical protein BVRB_002950 [Beta vulgaris subsp. vulgaris]|uniref:Uncharacterized protein n=1 Tax=Beta vulgaris subsp. vulgaris TaxID=3555 RepID=A0A0J8B8A0_BETVV|nr:hypothetical protein BVRB_002950 [Beta vulgaris subsp. vulgaris]
MAHPPTYFSGNTKRISPAAHYYLLKQNVDALKIFS